MARMCGGGGDVDGLSVLQTNTGAVLVSVGSERSVSLEVLSSSYWDNNEICLAEQIFVSIIVSALKLSDLDENYVISLEVDSSADFTDDPKTLCSVTISGVGRYSLSTTRRHIRELDPDATYIRLYATLAGTDPYMVYSARVSTRLSSRAATVTAVEVPELIEVAAASSSDASEIIDTGTVLVSNTVLGIQSNYAGAETSVGRILGLRFTNVPVANGAVVSDARLQVQSSLNLTEGALGRAKADATIWGEYTGDAAAFTTAGFSISSRTVTTAFVEWPLPSIEEDLVAWSQGTNQVSPNLATILTEIFSHASWVSGNNLVLIIRQTYGGPGARQFAAQDHATLAPPSLTLTLVA